MANVQGPKLELEIALNGIDDVNSKLTQLSNTIKLLNHVNVEITFDSKIEAVKKSISKTVKDIQQTIAKINENPIDFKVANKDDFNVFKAGLGDIDTALDGLSNKATALATQMKAITASGKTLAMAAGTKSADSKDTDKTNSYAAATERLTKALNKLHEVKPIELKFDPTNINAILGTLEHAVTKLNLVRNALGTALDLSKVKIPVPKKNSIDVNDDYFKRMGESISNSINNSMGKLDIGKQLNTSLAQIDFKGMADGINAALNKVYEQDKINKIPVVPTIDDKTIKGLKTRITNLIKEIKESDGKIPLELTLDLDKLRERLKVARGELDRFKKTDRFKPPLTLNLNDFKEKIKAAKEALKKFRESEETTVNLKIAINDANKVLADFNTANSSLLTDKTINVTLAYSEFDKGIKHVQEALASLKDMTIHINSNVKDVIAKEKVKEEELKAEKAEKKKQQQEAKEQKPAPDSKENYRIMLDNLMKHPLSNGKTPEGNATLQSRLSSIKTLQSAIEHGKAHPNDPNAFLVGIKEEGFLREQRRWLEEAIKAVGQNMTVSQARKELKKQERLKKQEQREKEQQEYNNRAIALNVKERFQQERDRQNQNNRNSSVYDESIKQDSNQRKVESDAIRQQMVEADKLERKIKDIQSQYKYSLHNTNPMQLKRYLQMAEVERDTIAKLNELNGSGSKHTPVFGSEADYNHYVTQFPNSTFAAQMANGRERAQTQRENDERKEQQRQERENARAQKEQDRQETAEATRATKEQERIDKEKQKERNRTIALIVQERFQEEKEQRKQQENLQKEIDRLEHKLQNLKSQYGYSFYNPNPMSLEKYMRLGDTERSTIAELNKLKGSPQNYTPVFGGSTDYKTYVARFTQGIQDSILKAEEKLRRIQQNYGFALYRDKPISLEQYMKYDTREQEAITQLNELHKKAGTTGNYSAVFGGQQGYDNYSSGYQVAKIKNDILKAEEKLKRIQQNYGFALYADKPMTLQRYMRYDAREQEAIAELNKLHGQAGTTGNYSAVFNGQQGYANYSNSYKVDKVEDELDNLQQKLADSKLGERPMKEQQFMANSTREQELIAELNKLNGTKRNSVYNGSNGYQQYLDDMRQIGKITAEEEKRNNLIQRRKDIAHEYSQELRKQNQLLQSGREVSQKEIDASERRIENIRRKWDNANWGANETKPELRQSYLHSRNAQEINQQNSVRNAMAWQSQYFSTANSKVGTLTASLEKLYTELKRNPGDAGIKKYIQEVSKELKQAKKEAKEVQQNLTAHTGSLTDGWKNKLSWIGGAFGFNESYDVAREFVSTITEINEGMANLATVMPELHHSEEAMVKEQTAMIDTAAKYGATIHDVIESARLWGRMYKEDDVPGATNLLAEQSVRLAVADNFSLEESTKAVEAAMFQYGLTATSAAEALAYSDRIIDVYTKLSHNAGVSAQDLAAGVERSGAAANQAGVDFEFLTAMIAQGTRSTALSGSAIGTMLKTLVASLRSDKAVAELEKINVKVKETVDGIEKFRDSRQILLDVALQGKYTDQDIQKPLLAISGGKPYEFAA